MSRRKAECDGSDIKRRGNITAKDCDIQRVTASGDIVTLVVSILFAMTRLFVMQKAVNSNTKGHILQRERPPITSRLTAYRVTKQILKQE